LDGARKLGDDARQLVTSKSNQIVELQTEAVQQRNELDAAWQDAEWMLRKAIDVTWGYALEDGSVPSTKIQGKIIATVRAALEGAPHEPANGTFGTEDCSASSIC
jgi:hypothetical protein